MLPSTYITGCFITICITYNALIIVTLKQSGIRTFDWHEQITQDDRIITMRMTKKHVHALLAIGCYLHIESYTHQISCQNLLVHEIIYLKRVSWLDVITDKLAHSPSTNITRYPLPPTSCSMRRKSSFCVATRFCDESGAITAAAAAVKDCGCCDAGSLLC